MFVKYAPGYACATTARSSCPMYTNRDGFHAINMQPGQAERICLEIPTMPRDRITGIGVQFYCGGLRTDAALGNRLTAEVWDMALERVETPENRDWLRSQPRAKLSIALADIAPYRGKLR